MTVSVDQRKTGVLVNDLDFGLQPYTGLVATRGIVSNNRHATNKQANVRTAHWARETLTSFQLVLGNYSVLTFSSTPVGTGEEAGAGGATTYEAAIEYPVGTYTRVTFSGSNTGTAADGATLVSDPVSVSIPIGAKFFVRQFIDTAGLLPYAFHPGMSALGTALGEGAEFAASGATSKVMAGSYTAATTTNVYPIAIIGTTSRPSVLFYGDSREAGSADTTNVTGDIGHGPRSVGIKYAYAGAMIPSDRASYVAANFAKRVLLVPYASHIVVNLGINDLNSGAASAFQTLTSLQTIWAAIAAAKQTQAKIFQTTIEPFTTSTDSWATLANQTVAALEAHRPSLNDTLRGTAQTNLTGVLDVADALESGRNSGKWQVTGAANGYTADGVHANAFGNYAVVRNGVMLAGMGL